MQPRHRIADASDDHVSLSDHIFDNTHYTTVSVTHMNEHQFASNLSHLSATSSKLLASENWG